MPKNYQVKVGDKVIYDGPSLADAEHSFLMADCSKGDVEFFEDGKSIDSEPQR